jgi:hypothetical protein
MRKIWGERDARACVKAAKAAGLSLGAWARTHGVDGRSLHAWSVNLGLAASSASATSVTPTLIELVPPPGARAAARYQVRVGDVAVEVDDDFADESLARIVRVLRTC